MKRRFLALLLIFSLTGTLFAGCGTGAEQTTPNDESVTEPIPESSEIPAPTENSTSPVAPTTDSIMVEDTPSITEQPTPTETVVPTEIPEPTETATPTETPTSTKAPDPTSVPVPTSTPTPEPTATPVPTNTPTPKPTATPVPTNTPTPKPTNTPVPTSTPTPKPTIAPAYESINTEIEDNYFDIPLPGTFDKELAKETFILTNKMRKEHSVPELIWDGCLYESARVRAAESSLYFSHTRLDGTDCFTIYDKLHGENLACNYSSAESVVNGWMSSEGHKANILNSNFTRGSIAVFKTLTGWYYCQHFGY